MSSESAALVVWSPREESAAGRRHEAARARRRGLAQAAIGLGVGGLLAWSWRPLAGGIVAGVGVGLALLAWLSPLRGHRAVQRGLARFARGAAAAVAWTLLALVTVGVFWPLGAVLRARRRLRITTGFDPGQSSYWTRAAARPGPEPYRRQY